MQWFDRVLICALIVTIIFATAVLIVHVRKGSSPEIVISGVGSASSGIESVSKPLKIKVHVKGAVRKPGVYEFAAGERVEDAIRKAGGGLPTADIEAINLAAFLKDGDEVFVPDRRARALEVFSEAMSLTQRSSSSSRHKAKTQKMPVGRVAINTATVEQLESLPGVGPALAQRIVEYRRRNGPFKSVEELLNVKGIGEKKLEALRPYVKLW
ncbi:MAG: helix-hairpin-helix domain-containing protein [Armatimonadota bacterium]|nr:helix-hairpin-helix domain-containing protein [Armatimonadota bacterium]MDW8025075.1 helix-hairpin-helix domain-containing protein [Armatimonadota bacterium]